MSNFSHSARRNPGSEQFIPWFPSRVAAQLRDAVPRSWLTNKIEAILESLQPESSKAGDARILIIFGEPGSGKTILSAILASRWRCSAYFIRLGSTDGVIWKDPKTLFISIGLQLRALYGPEIFGPYSLEVKTNIQVKEGKPGSRTEGLDLGVITISPFQRVLLDADLNFGSLSGEALGIKIAEVRDGTLNMTVARLAQEAVIEPLKRIAEINPTKRVRIIIDSLDESEEITKSIPLIGELPDNVDLVLTSRSGNRLNRFIDEDDNNRVVRINLSDPDFLERCVGDAGEYTRKRLKDSSFSTLLQSPPGGANKVEDMVAEIARTSQGNFLYLYHLLKSIGKELEQGQFDPTTFLRSLPQGLNNIYRYFVTDRIRAKVGSQEWESKYALVLGILAVAREPLTIKQLEDYSGTTRICISEVLGAIDPFIESITQRNEASFQIFHGSFADYLLTQDYSRNPYPLYDETYYHIKIIEFYEGFDDSRWKTCNDLYALTHLATHLRKVGRIEQMCKLLTGPFALRQTNIIGLFQMREDCMQAARAAALGGYDESFLLMLHNNLQVEEKISASWKQGYYALSMLVDEPKMIIESAKASCGNLIPWAYFLAAERLIDLGKVTEACNLLRLVECQAWPYFRWDNMSATDLPEDSAFDFNLQIELISFLARVAAIDASLALKLVKRLYPASRSRAPNALTAWRDVLRAYLSTLEQRGNAPITARQCYELVNATRESFEEEHNLLGMAGVSRCLFSLINYAIPSSKVNNRWIVNALQFAAGFRMKSYSTTIGALDSTEDKSPGMLITLAEVLKGLMDAWEVARLKEKTAKSRASTRSSTGAYRDVYSQVAENYIESGIPSLSAVLEDFWRRIVNKTVRVTIPKKGTYSHRAESIGKMAYVLYRAGSKLWREYAAAGLKSCSLDASLNDPPLHSIGVCLKLLSYLPDKKIASKAETLAEKYNLAELQNKLDDFQIWKFGQGYRYTQKELALEDLRPGLDPYELGYIVLSLARQRTATVKQIEHRLDENNRAGSDNGVMNTGNSVSAFANAFAKALSYILVDTGTSIAADAINRLSKIFREEFESAETYQAAQIKWPRWDLLRAKGEIDTLRREVESDYEKAQAKQDYDMQITCCIAAAAFDPELADKWYKQFDEGFTDPGQRGFLITLLVEKLNEFKPDRLADLGSRWASDLPNIDTLDEMLEYEVYLCTSWSDLEILRPGVIAHLRHLANVLPKELQASVTKASQLEDSPKKQSEASEILKTLGMILCSIGHVKILKEDGSHEIIKKLAEATGQSWKDSVDILFQGNYQAAFDLLLEGIRSAPLLSPLPSHPVIDVLIDLFDSSVEQIKKKRDDERHDMPFLYGEFHLDLAKMKRSGVSLAVYLKAVNAEWAKARFEEASALFRELLAAEPSGFLTRMSLIIEESRIRSSGEFLDWRTAFLFNLTRMLMGFSVSEPQSPDLLKSLQSTIQQGINTELQSCLIGPIATGWLLLNEIKICSGLAELTDSKYLAKGHFTQVLYGKMKEAYALPESFSVRDLKPIILSAILRASLRETRNDLHDGLAAWLLLRAKEQTGNYDDADGSERAEHYLLGLVELAVQLAKSQSGQT